MSISMKQPCALRNTPVSIVIDNYNGSQFVRHAIDSALDQTYSDIEVIVVDDGSTDGSRAAIRAYGERVRPIFKENGGQGSALNRGFEASHGSVVVFLDSDDLLSPTAVEQIVPCFEDPDVAKVHWPMSTVDRYGVSLGPLYPPCDLAEGDLRPQAFARGPANHMSAPTSGNAWSRKFLSSILPMPEDDFRICADTYLFELAPFFGKIGWLREPLSSYRIHGGNLHWSMPGAQRIANELTYYDACCDFLNRYFRANGVDVDVERWKKHSWWHRQHQAIQELAALNDPDKPIILVDDDAWEAGNVGGRKRLPFVERNGEYWGPPDDDSVAINELQRMLSLNPAYLVFAWGSFWWFDHYPGFLSYLQSTFPCALRTERIVVFDLRPQARR